MPRRIVFLGMRPRTWIVLALAWVVVYVVAVGQDYGGLSFYGYTLVFAAFLGLAMIFRGPRSAARWLLRSAFWRVRSARVRRQPPNADLLSILTLSTYGFEMYCRDLLQGEGYTATVTKATGDEGVDVELRAKDGRIGVAQCKQVLNARIGRPVLQQLYGEMINRRATFGFLMTTSTFTDEAREWARTKTITLVDREELLRMAARQSPHP